MITQDSFVVLNQLSYEPELKDKIMRLIYLSMPLFRNQEGLISATAHHHVHESKTMTYFVWESEEHYLKCLKSDDFAQIAAQWNELIQSGKAKFEMNAYSVIDSYSRHLETIF